jgi:arginase
MGFSPKVDGINVPIVGAREFDEWGAGERHTIKEMRVNLFESDLWTEGQMRNSMRKAIEYACNGTVGFHLSFDIDFIDPEFAPAVGTPVKNGATEAIAKMAIEVARDSRKMISMDMVEVNPVLDEKDFDQKNVVGLLISRAASFLQPFMNREAQINSVPLTDSPKNSPKIATAYT